MSDLPINKPGNLGVLLVNLGTPDAPTVPAIRRYLAEFLADPRVVAIPRFIWLPILYGFVLPFRPRKVVDKYQFIWGENDAPIREYTFDLAQRVQTELESKQPGHKTFVKSAMTYGNPSIKNAIEELLAQGIADLMIIPLFPQYSAATTAAVFDKFSSVIANTRVLPGFRFISEYHREPAYIQAITQSIQPSVSRLSSDTRLLFSFHGLPKAQVALGDPYPEQCKVTADLVVSNLKLDSSQWMLTFQSRFGPSKWLTPYTSDTLAGLPDQGVKHVILICPGFAVDCLETLEEIKVMNKQIFLDAGGESFTYIPALNAETSHVSVMTDLIDTHRERVT